MGVGLGAAASMKRADTGPSLPDRQRADYSASVAFLDRTQ
jgi:hypothetical protein